MSVELILSTFVGSGASFAALTLLFDHLKHRRQREEEASFLALRISFLLEAFASDCADAVMEHENSRTSGGHAGKSIGKVPALTPFPESEAYKYFERGLLHDVLELPHRRHIAQQDASSVWEYVGDPDDYEDAVAKNTLSVASHALEIAKRLRAAYRQPARQFGFANDWSLEEYLAGELARHLEADRRRGEEAAALTEEMTQRAKGAAASS